MLVVQPRGAYNVYREELTISLQHQIFRIIIL